MEKAKVSGQQVVSLQDKKRQRAENGEVDE
jgi:hypothetical protein